MQINSIAASSILTRSNLPVSDYSANPYVGCEHACKYCYASFMKRFTNHPENWGEFVDVKTWPALKASKYHDKEIFLSSVTDPYNTLDENFRSSMDKAVSIERRFNAMKIFHDSGIRTTCFISPIFPGITDVEAIITRAKNICNLVWLENLNLRGNYKPVILNWIHENRPELDSLYHEIYTQKDFTYWQELDARIKIFAENNGLDYVRNDDSFKRAFNEPPIIVNYFYHDELVKSKKKL